MTSRYWLIMINNPDQDFEDFQDANICTLVGQQEKGEEGTVHWQLYVEYRNPVRLGSVKRVFKRCHAEKRRGTRADALRYCTKSESRVDGPFYRGLSPDVAESIISGRSSDKQKAALLEVQKKLKEGASEAEIAEEHFDLWVRYYGF